MSRATATTIPSVQKSAPSSNIAKSQRPRRKAATKFLDTLAKYRKMLDDYHTAYRKYTNDKKTNAKAVPPPKPKIPKEYYEALTADDDDDQEKEDEEFSGDDESDDDDDFDDDDDDNDEDE